MPGKSVLALAYALRRDHSPRWTLWTFVGIAGIGFVAMLPVFTAFVGASTQMIGPRLIFRAGSKPSLGNGYR